MNEFDEIGAPNEFDEIGGALGKPDVSSAGAFVRHAGPGVLPNLAGVAAVGAGAEIGAAAGAFGGPLAPITVPAGGFLGGLGGFFLGSTAMEHAQRWALSKLPDSWTEALGQDDRQQRLDAMHAPNASFIGSLAPYALTMRPGGFSRTALPANATAFQRIMAHPATSRVFGGGIMGGMELGGEAVSDDKVDWTKVAISTGFGVVFNKPTKFGEAISNIGAKPVAAGISRLRTLAQASDAGVLGPGITEDTFQGVQQRSDEVAAASSDAVRQEAALLGDEASDAMGRRGINVHDVARQMHPDLFDQYDALTKRRDVLRNWTDEIGGGQAQIHLAATESELAKLEPQVQAAYRRAAEASGAPIVEEGSEGRTPIDIGSGQQVHVDTSHTVVSIANSSTHDPGLVYIDHRLERFTPEVTQADGRPADLYKYLAIHETVEGAQMRTRVAAEERRLGRKLTQGEFDKIYGDVHTDIATPAEHAALRADGVDPKAYEAFIAKHAKAIEGEKDTNPPPDPHVNPEESIGRHRHAGEVEPPGEQGGAATTKAAKNIPQNIPGAEPPYATAAHKAAIAADVERQLVAAGRPAEEAKAAGALIAARYAARATWLKGGLGTAEELYQQEGAEIRGPKGAAPASGNLPPRTPQSPLASPVWSGSTAVEARKPTGARAKPQEQWSLFEFIASLGGVKADDPLAGDVRHMLGRDNALIPGFGPLIRKDGKPLDRLREAAGGAGYLFDRGDVTGGEAETDINTLLQAMGEEAAGNKQFRAGAQIPRSRHEIERAEDEAAYRADEDVPFWQDARGQIRLRPNGRPIITLTKDANASTFVHESGHDFLEQMMRDAARPEAPDPLKNDAATVMNWIGANPGERIPTKGHEKFARGFEQYLREGVAPSKELAGVFAKFKQWLVSIYRTLKGLGAPINNDIRKVFDRMLSAEPQRTVIAGEDGERPTLQDIHEADATEHSPQTAQGAAQLVDSERARYAETPPPKVADEIAAEIERTAEPAAGEGEGGERPGEVVEAGGKPAAQPASGDVREEQRPQREGKPDAVGQGAEPPAAERGSGPAGEGIGNNPLAPKPAEQFEPGSSFNVGKDGNVRVENITSVPDLISAINESSDRIGGGGQLTMGEMQSLADDVLLPVDKIDEAHLARVFGGIQNLSSKIWALRTAIRDSAQLVSDAMKKAAQSQHPADLAAMAVAIERHDMMQSVLSSVTTETGRALGMGFRNLEGWEKAQDLGLFLKDNTGRTLFQLQQTANLGAMLKTPGQISKFLRDARKRSFGGMILEYWINGLISGPTTHITYMMGNAVLASMGVPETLIGAGVGKLLGHTQGLRFGEAGALIRGAAKGVPGAFEAAIEAAHSGMTTLLPGEEGRPLMPFQGATALTVAKQATNDPVAWRDVGAGLFGMMRGIRDGFVAGAQIQGAPLVGLQYSALGQIPDIAVKGYDVLPLGTMARLPGRGVAVIHSFFRSINYSMQKSAEAYREAATLGLSGQAFDAHVANVWQNPSLDVMERARAQSTELTLMGQGGEFVKALSRLTNATVDLPLLGETAPLKFIDPFVHIGANVIKQSLVQRTPLGLLSAEIRADLAGKNGQVAQEMAAGRMLAGTSLALLFGGMAMQGYATGSGPKDPAKQAMWRLAGYQAHSVRIGDTWYDVHRLGPIGMLMGIAADMWDVAHEASQGQMMEAAAHLQHALTQNVLDESFMRGPADLIKAIEDPGRYGEAYLRNFVSSFVPYSVGMAQMARAADPYSRQARSVMDAIKAKVPGLSETLFPRRDVWGEEIANLDALGKAGVTAIYERRMSTDPVNRAMLQLGIAPAQIERKIRNVELTDAQYDDFARIAGRQTKMRLDTIVRSPDWSTWPAHVQHDVITETLRQSREAARGMMMMKYPDIAHQATDVRMKKRSDEAIVPLH